MLWNCFKCKLVPSSLALVHLSISKPYHTHVERKKCDTHFDATCYCDLRNTSPNNLQYSVIDLPPFSTHTTITSIEQRQRYKDDFNVDYSHYTRLHKEVAAVQKRFAHMKEKLHKLPEDSDEYRSISEKVIEEYNIIKAVSAILCEMFASLK